MSSSDGWTPVPLRSACCAFERRIKPEKPVRSPRIAAVSTIRSIPIAAIHSDSDSDSDSIAASRFLVQFMLVLVDQSQRNQEIIRPTLQREIAKQQLVKLRKLRFSMQFHQDIFEIVLQLLVLLLELHLLGSHHDELLRELVDSERVGRCVGEMQTLHQREEIREEKGRSMRGNHRLREVNRGNRVCELHGSIQK